MIASRSCCVGTVAVVVVVSGERGLRWKEKTEVGELGLLPSIAATVSSRDGGDNDATRGFILWLGEIAAQDPGSS